MKAKDWQKATQMVQERQSQMTIPDTTELSSFCLSWLSLDQSRPPVVVHGIDAPLSTSTPIQAQISNQQATQDAHEETSYRQVLHNISQQSLYPSLAAMGTLINTSVSPEIPFSRRVIKTLRTTKEYFFLIQSKVLIEEQMPLQYLVQQTSRSKIQF